jgi:hypothetical protein
MKAKQLILIAIMLFTATCNGAAQTNVGNISPKNSATHANQNVKDSNLTRQTPESVINEIYAIHAEDVKSETGDRIINGIERDSLDKYFDKKLADLIWNDFTAERGEDDANETGVIDFDLFYATQEDLPVTNLRISHPQFANDKATVRASFTSGGARETVEYLLIEKDGAWKITDIKYRNGNSLLKLFKDAAR